MCRVECFGRGGRRLELSAERKSNFGVGKPITNRQRDTRGKDRTKQESPGKGERR